MTEFDERIERAKQSPQLEPRFTPGRKPGSEAKRRAETRRRDEDHRVAKSDVLLKVKAVSGQLKAQAMRGDSWPDFAVIDGGSRVFEKARKKLNGNRSSGLGGPGAMPSPSVKQQGRWQDRSERYMERELARRAMPGWSLGMIWTRSAGPDDDYSPTAFREHVLAWDGNIYDRDPQAEALLRTRLTRLSMPAQTIDIIRVTSPPSLESSERVDDALQGLANLVVRFNLDVTRIA